MSLPSDPRLILHNKVVQSLLYLREYRIISEQLISMIDGSTLTGLAVVEKFHAIVQVRASLLTCIGGHENKNVRDQISAEFDVSCESELIKIEAQIDLLLDTMVTLLDRVAQEGQIVSVTKEHGRIDSLILPEKSTFIKTASLEVQKVIDS